MSSYQSTVKNKSKNILIVSMASATLLAPVSLAIQARAMSTSAYVTLSSFSGHPDSSLTINGGNYQKDELISVTAVENGVKVINVDATANNYGSFSTNLTLPIKLPQGQLSFTAAGQTSGLNSANSYYVVPFAPTLSVNSTNTVAYGSVVVSGDGFAPNEVIDLNFAGQTTTAQADNLGNFQSVKISTPHVPAGSYKIIAVGKASGSSAVAYEYVNNFYPSASPSSYYVMPLSQLSFNGSGFAPGETVTVADETSGATLSSFMTDANGSFKSAGGFIVPSSYAGLTKKFILTGNLSGATTTLSTNVGRYYPSISPSIYYVQPGQTLSFNGSGFAPGETINVMSSSQLQTTAVASITGTITLAGSVIVSPSAAGTTQTYDLIGVTSQGSASVSVAIASYNPQVSPSAYYLMPGSTLNFSGSGFQPNETVEVLSGQKVVSTIKTDATGSFLSSGNIAIAYSQAGTSATYTLVGQTSNVSTSITLSVGQLNTQLSPSAYYVLPYAPFNATVTGFAPNDTVQLKSGTTVLAETSTNAKGTATFTNVIVSDTSKSSVLLTANSTTSGANASASIVIGKYNPYITLNSYYAKPGDNINVSGSGFAPNEPITVTAGTSTVKAIADKTGSFTTSLTIPLGQTKNTFSITAIGSLSTAATTTSITLAPFNPQVSPTTYYAEPGTTVKFSGSGFVSGETINVSLNGVYVNSLTANSKGSFTGGTYVLPYGKNAAYSFIGALSLAKANVAIGLAQFYSGIQLNSYYGNGGIDVIVSGSGFASGEQVQLMAGSTSLGQVAASSTGSFTKTVTMPYAQPGKMVITASGELSDSQATTAYTVAQVYSSVQLAKYVVHAGQNVELIGSGFLPNDQIEVTSNRTAAYSLAATSTGMFDDSGFTLPVNLTPGDLTLTITGTHSFTVEKITIYVQSPA